MRTQVNQSKSYIQLTLSEYVQAYGTSVVPIITTGIELNTSA